MGTLNPADAKLGNKTEEQSMKRSERRDSCPGTKSSCKAPSGKMFKHNCAWPCFFFVFSLRAFSPLQVARLSGDSCHEGAMNSIDELERDLALPKSDVIGESDDESLFHDVPNSQ